MKNKDWKTELRRSWGHLYLLNEDNEFCKIINEIDDLEDFISSEIEKAREEGYRKGAIDMFDKLEMFPIPKDYLEEFVSKLNKEEK